MKSLSIEYIPHARRLLAVNFNTYELSSNFVLQVDSHELYGNCSDYTPVVC